MRSFVLKLVFALAFFGVCWGAAGYNGWVMTGFLLVGAWAFLMSVEVPHERRN